MKNEQLVDCEGITLESAKPFAFSCCDCGLTHHMIIVSEDGRPVGFAVKRITPAPEQATPAPSVPAGGEVRELVESLRDVLTCCKNWSDPEHDDDSTVFPVLQVSRAIGLADSFLATQAQDVALQKMAELTHELGLAPLTPQDAAPAVAVEARSDKDYAIEHAEYMAKDGERLIDAVHDLARAESEHGDGRANESDVIAAGNTLSEALVSLRDGIYEFRKRRDRAASPSPIGREAGSSDHSVPCAGGGVTQPPSDAPRWQVGTWTLTAPDGRTWQADSPLKACSAEQRDRIPPDVALKRIFDALDDGGGAT